jgi:hypothetical protein
VLGTAPARNGHFVVRKRLWRSGVIAYFRSPEPCLVGMEARATAHYDDLLETPQQLYRFAEADDYADDTAAPTVDQPQLGRSLETALST